MYVLLLYKHNKINKCASIGSHGDPKDKESVVIGSAI